MPTTNLARLALKDGSVFHGQAFGGSPNDLEGSGEAVFNTAMCGYHEGLTDRSYTGQILTMTATEIGDCGIVPEDIDSARPCVAGFVVRELWRIASNHRSAHTLSDWLADAVVPATSGDGVALIDPPPMRVRGS